MGPIPWEWLRQAARCSGHAMHVGIFLWWLAGMKNSATIVLSVSSVGDELGFTRHTTGRALDDLAEVGLIACQRHSGRKPRVTLLHV